MEHVWQPSKIYPVDAKEGASKAEVCRQCGWSKLHYHNSDAVAYRNISELTFVEPVCNPIKRE